MSLPQIFQCSEGHVVCRVCVAGVEICCECGGRVGAPPPCGRADALEKTVKRILEAAGLEVEDGETADQDENDEKVTNRATLETV